MDRPSWKRRVSDTTLARVYSPLLADDEHENNSHGQISSTTVVEGDSHDVLAHQSMI